LPTILQFRVLLSPLTYNPTLYTSPIAQGSSAKITFPKWSTNPRGILYI
jgi:hypothetical protein